MWGLIGAFNHFTGCSRIGGWLRGWYFSAAGWEKLSLVL